MRVAVDGVVIDSAVDGSVANGADSTSTPAVDLRDEPVDAAAVQTAITDEHPALTIDCPAPSRRWELLCRPDDGTSPLDRIVAAARSLGHHPPAERSLAAAQRERRSISVESVDTATTRRRLADAGNEVDRLREAVATARGRLQSRRELDADIADAESALEGATRRLSEAETERIAAEQAHAAAKRRERAAREARERRLRVEDRIANRRRDTRRALATAVHEQFEAAIGPLPGNAALSLDPLGVEGDPVVAALAAAQIADIRAPIIDATGRFADATDAVLALDSPVVLV